MFSSSAVRRATVDDYCRSFVEIRRLPQAHHAHVTSRFYEARMIKPRISEAFLSGLQERKLSFSFFFAVSERPHAREQLRRRHSPLEPPEASPRLTDAMVVWCSRLLVWQARDPSATPRVSITSPCARCLHELVSCKNTTPLPHSLPYQPVAETTIISVFVRCTVTSSRRANLLVLRAKCPVRMSEAKCRM